MMTDLKQFETTSLVFDKEPEAFSESDAPAWLTSANTVKGSTMDERWFWNDHILTLRVGESVETDFNRIKRVR